MTFDPTRLSDPGSDASTPLRKLLHSTMNDDPSSGELQRLEARLGPQLGTGQPGPTSPPVRAVGISGGKIAALVAVVVVGVGGFFIGRATAPDRSADATPNPVVPSVDRTPVPAPRSTDIASPALPAPPPRATPVSAPPPPRSRRAATSPIDHPQPADTTEQAPALETNDEITILTTAQRALVAGDPRGAMELLVAGAARFPQGAFVEEREALAIEALVALKRVDEARTQLEAFRTRFPRSTYRERLERLFAAE